MTTAKDVARHIEAHKRKSKTRKSHKAEMFEALGGFASMKDVIAWAKSGHPLYYKAPMDPHAKRLHDFKLMARSIRIWPSGSRGRGRMRTADPFTANAGHLERFRKSAS
jgi:hypothetical protein